MRQKGRKPNRIEEGSIKNEKGRRILKEKGEGTEQRRQQRGRRED